MTKFIQKIIEENSSETHFVYSKSDLKSLFSDLTDENFNMILSRCVKNGLLQRICKGIYLYPKVNASKSLVLYKVASKLRADCINYLSLETVLSENSFISQQLLGWITIMTSGRSGIVDCGKYGSIEFIHTQKKFENIFKNLFLDTRYGILKAKPILAYRDMIDAKRKTLELVDFEEIKKVVENEQI